VNLASSLGTKQNGVRPQSQGVLRVVERPFAIDTVPISISPEAGNIAGQGRELDWRGWSTDWGFQSSQNGLPDVPCDL